jgi:methionyl-tRNA formyltransferase
LPEWRGADPITFAILSGQHATGVSLMMLVAGMDEGPVLAYATHELSETTTTTELTHDLIHVSDAMLKKIIPMYLAGEVTPKPQNETHASYSRKLTKDDGIIDWGKPAAQIEREIRAFIEWPKSHAFIGGTSVIITAAHVVEATGTPGTFGVHNKQLIAFCGQKALIIERLKPAGKKEMTGQAFLAGYKHLLQA